MTTLDLKWSSGIYVLDHIAHLDDDGLHVLDRRVFPFETSYVHCPDVPAVARAIIDMVTQSRGPGVVAGYGMVLAAAEAASSPEPLRVLERLAETLRNTRHTNNAVQSAVNAALEICRTKAPTEWVAAAAEVLRVREENRHAATARIGELGAELLGENARLLTHCWAESGIAEIVQTAISSGKQVTAYCDETRPYLQGARLTADALRDAGADVIVVPDGAAGYLISEGCVDLAITGADRVAADGGVANKIGTLGIAATCSRFGVPYYAITLGPDLSTPDVWGVPMEIRDPEEALHCLGQRTATTGVAGFYPAFDRTPPDLVTGIITADGVIPPGELAKATTNAV